MKWMAYLCYGLIDWLIHVIEFEPLLYVMLCYGSHMLSITYVMIHIYYKLCML